jgi:hypothetical protein
MAATMESPNKRLKRSPPDEHRGEEDDFVPLNFDDEDNNNASQYGYGAASPPPNGLAMEGISHASASAPRGPKAMSQRPPHSRHDVRNDPRHAKDTPKSKHLLPGHDPWVLVKTKFGRRFVHNAETKESLWRIPKDVMQAVLDFERLEVVEMEKKANAKWAEEQLKEMRSQGTATSATKATGGEDDSRPRRRRSESLQREDEAALMAELTAEAEKGEEQDAKAVVENVASLQPKTVADVVEGGYGSDSSYEEVEVTDSEFEDDDGLSKPALTNAEDQKGSPEDPDPNAPVEFGEDDIAYQLAAMQEDYGLDEDKYSDDAEAMVYDDEPPMEDEGITEEEAAAEFRQMLTDHRISPFTPWDKLITDESENSILYDDRYTLLPNTRSRKAVWEAWVKDAAATRAEERKKAELEDPRIPYLRFLEAKASPKLYWQEFKRKFKKEAVMNERRLSDKEREKLYRDYISRLKLPESRRKADLKSLLEGMKLKVLNKATSMDDLPQDLLSHLNYASLPSGVRDPIVEKHIATLPPVPVEEEGEIDDADLERRRKETARREKALAEREKQVEEERREAEKEGRWARREAKEAEREVREAMAVGNRGLRGQLAD